MRNSKCVQKVVQSGRRAWLKMRNHRLLAFIVTLANVYRITSDSTQQANARHGGSRCCQTLRL